MRSGIFLSQPISASGKSGKQRGDKEYQVRNDECRTRNNGQTPTPREFTETKIFLSFRNVSGSCGFNYFFSCNNLKRKDPLSAQSFCQYCVRSLYFDYGTIVVNIKLRGVRRVHYLNRLALLQLLSEYAGTDDGKRTMKLVMKMF